MRTLIGILVCCLFACGKKNDGPKPSSLQRDAAVRIIDGKAYLRISNPDGTATIVPDDAVAGKTQKFIVCDRENKCTPKHEKLEGPCPGPECHIVKCDCKLSSCAGQCNPFPPDTEMKAIFNPLPGGAAGVR